MRKALDPSQLYSINKWFPSKHSGVSGMGAVEKKLSAMDCIIEVHDARVPISGRNSYFLQKLRAARPHLLLYNKSDTIPRRAIPYLRELVQEREADSPFPLHSPPLFCSAYKNRKIEHIIPRAVRTIEAFFKNNLDFERKHHTIMIVGVPNVGKSSIINAVREIYTGLENMAAKIGPKPGVTRTVMQTIRVSEHPKVYIVDTPGVIEATPVNIESALRLALCGCTLDSIVGYELMAAYLLNFFHKRGIDTYVNYMGLQKPTDDLNLLLSTCTKMLHRNTKVKNFGPEGGYKAAHQTEKAAEYFVRSFRAQKFGNIILDDECLPPHIPCWELKTKKGDEREENRAANERNFIDDRLEDSDNK